MTREEAHTLLEIMAINITGELVGSGHLITEQTKLLAKQLEAIDMAIEALQEPKTGEWFDRPKGYYCSVCGKWCDRGTYNFCPNCGAKMAVIWND